MNSEITGGSSIIVNRQTVFIAITTFCMIALILPLLFSFAQAQTEITFFPTETFGIPTYNGTISFATGGTYTQANLENDAWNFENLRLNNSGLTKNLIVSAQNSNVTILSYREFNVTAVGVMLRYDVVGYGRQTFNLGLNAKEGDWSVILNGKFVSINDGWFMSPDQTITVTGATSNVIILYYNFSASIGGDRNSSFYQQHSVAIITAVAVATTVVLAVIIRIKTKNDFAENAGGADPKEKRWRGNKYDP
jgi:hypothetical protein